VHCSSTLKSGRASLPSICKSTPLLCPYKIPRQMHSGYTLLRLNVQIHSSPLSVSMIACTFRILFARSRPTPFLSMLISSV
jgi:hypothetical protein